MKYVGKLLLFTIFLWAGCAKEEVTLNKIKKLPEHLQGLVTADHKLESINDGSKVFYVIFKSDGNVEAKLETDGKTVVINIEKTGTSDGQLRDYYYYVTRDSYHDEVLVYVDGEMTPFDAIITN